MIQTRNLFFEYDAEKQFYFPDLEIPQGAHALLLGASGSGKTTMLNLLCGLLRPQKGNLSIAHTDWSSYTQAQIDRFRGRNIGMIFQKSYFLPSLSVLDNLRWAQRLAGRKANTAKIQQQLDKVGLADSLKKYPQALSIGEQQRISIARALLHEPKVVLADEPTSALDDQNCEKVLSLIREFCDEAKATLLIVTHDARVRSRIQKHYELQK
ncbi:MAG: ATP-binding cassette domain-containing protein [Bernardetiaceae bacterium]|nr:ATP-binding cassette domain-containing protein [Bernardetiaceae bacterium]